MIKTKPLRGNPAFIEVFSDEYLNNPPKVWVAELSATEIRNLTDPDPDLRKLTDEQGAVMKWGVHLPGEAPLYWVFPTKRRAMGFACEYVSRDVSGDKICGKYDGVSVA